MLMIMIWSGLLIYWAHDVYRVGIGEWTLFSFFPKWFYLTFDLNGHLATGMAYHFTFAWIFVANGLLYVVYLLISKEWRDILPQKSSLKEAWYVVLHDIGFKSIPHPDRTSTYNAAQRISYTAIIGMGAGSVLTGLAIYKPIQLSWLTAFFGGYEWARIEHFCLTLGFCLFFVVHILQVIRAGWNNFRSMVTGFEIQTIDTPEASSNLDIEEDSRRAKRRTFLGFATLGAGAIASGIGWKWLRMQPESDGMLTPLRTMLDFNGNLNQHLLYSPSHLAPIFPRSKAAVNPRINGDVGLETALTLEEWKLTIVHDKDLPPLVISFTELTALPKIELCFEFKCVEGWSEIQHWGGIRLADVFEKFNIPTTSHYVGMTTPDEEYYVGLDMASALHPQTLLAFESNGKPISQEQGFPLRLIMPIKYGFKNIKRIGKITLSDHRPDDYWAEDGYDYDAGL